MSMSATKRQSKQMFINSNKLLPKSKADNV